MGMLIDGIWEDTAIINNNEEGSFVRPDSAFRHWIKENTNIPPMMNRYHLYISYACPWACRTIMLLQLKGLTHAISYSTVTPLMLENGWEFTDTFPDKLNHYKYLHQVYTKSDSAYTGKVTVPVLWDKENKIIINNESADILKMINEEFNEFATIQFDANPLKHQTEINELNEFIYKNINNGVYKCGFAQSQKAYDEAFDKLFSALDEIELRLATNRYLVGNVLTEADIRLFTTLIRFDVVYYDHFKCNLKAIETYPNLSGYVRDIYQIPGVVQTVDFDQIKTHYYASHKNINPLGIIARGPLLDYNTKHNREKLSS